MGMDYLISYERIRRLHIAARLVGSMILKCFIEPFDVWDRERPAVTDNAVCRILTVVIEGNVRLKSVASRRNVELQTLCKSAGRVVDFRLF